MPLTNENAQRMISASQSHARALGVAVTTAIIDSEGRLFAFARMDGTHWVTVEVAQAKAFAAALFRRDGSELQNVPAENVAALAAMHGRGLMPMGSVTTLREGDRVIAGIGCSGATDEQDGECARAARDAYAG